MVLPESAPGAEQLRDKPAPAIDPITAPSYFARYSLIGTHTDYTDAEAQTHWRKIRQQQNELESALLTVHRR